LGWRLGISCKIDTLGCGFNQASANHYALIVSDTNCVSAVAEMQVWEVAMWHFILWRLMNEFFSKDERRKSYFRPMELSSVKN